MKPSKTFFATGIISLCLLFHIQLQAQGNHLLAGMNKGAQQHTGEALTQLSFTPNKGQIADQDNNPREEVLFSAQSGSMTIHLRRSGISYQQYRFDKWKAVEGRALFKPGTSDSVPDQFTIYRTDIEWVGINPGVTIQRGEELPGLTHYYMASCPDGATNVKSFKSVTYHEIYPGIDLKYYNNSGRLEYDFILQPGADPRQIRWKIVGAGHIEINNAGELLITTSLGKIHEQAPLAYQGNKMISAGWSLNGKEVSFKLGPYDEEQPLTIDPVVREWSTYYGGPNDDHFQQIAVDSDGNIIVSGQTSSATSIATSGAHQTTFAGGTAIVTDAFVAKFDSSGTRLWSTYYGGSGFELYGYCATDGAGNIFLAGTTSSPAAIATTTAHQPSLSSSIRDAFLVKFDPLGIRQWGTYYGGSSDELALACATDAGGNVYLAGATPSTDSISTPGSHQPVGGGSFDGFLVKFNGSGVRLWGTYYGGGQNDFITAIAVDQLSNAVYVGGSTGSPSGISTPGAHQILLGGSSDGFVAKFNSSGTRQWSTYYGGAGEDGISSCAAGQGAELYVCGQTNSTSGISTPGAHQPAFGGGSGDDGFLVKFNQLGALQWGTYYGGSGNEGGTGCVAQNGAVYLTGHCGSTTSIATPGSYQPSLGGSTDAYMARFDNTGVRQWGSYYGGVGADEGRSCAVSGIGHNKALYVAGTTRSTSSIATPLAHQAAFAGGIYDGFIAKFRECDATRDTISPVEYCVFTSPSGKYAWDTSGTYHDTLTNLAGCDSLILINLTITPGVPYLTSLVTGSRCGPGTVTLQATANRGNIEWRADTTTGPVLGTGSSFVTPAISMTTDFYVTVSDSNCAMPHTPVTATVIPNKFLSIDTTVCIEYKAPSGVIYTTTGKHYDAVQNSTSCYDVMTIELTVKGIKAMVTLDGTELVSNGLPTDTIQWVNCKDTTDIPGATGQSFTLAGPGSYAARITRSGCVSLSNCYNYVIPGIEQTEDRFFHAYPNPTDGRLTIVMDRSYREVSIRLLNMQGQIIKSWEKTNVQTIELNVEEPPGPYLIDVTTPQGNDRLLLIHR